MNILIINRYPLRRYGLMLALQTLVSDSEVYSADDIPQKNNPYYYLKPELILLDLNHHSLSQCISKVQLATKQYPSSRIIACDSDMHRHAIIELLKIGIKGFLSKFSSLEETTLCISEVMEGNRYIEVSALIDSILINHAVERKPDRDLHRLTQNERKIASYIVSGMKTSEIGKIVNRKISTISTIKANIFRKLDVSNIIDLAAAMREQKVE